MLESSRHIVDWQTPPYNYRSDLPETIKNDVDNAQIRRIGWQLPHDIMQRLSNVSNILKCIVICHFKAFVDTLSCSCNAVAVLLHKVAEVACVQSFYLRCGYCCYCEYKQFKLRH